MDEQARVILQRILRKIPVKKTQSTLRAWGCLSAEQLEDLNYTQPKWLLLENIISKCEESRLRLKDVTKLEMVYYMENPNQGKWHALKLTDAEEEATSVDFTQFKEMFNSHLTEQNASIRIKMQNDGAVWIRMAWAENFTRPKHHNPTYAVHYLQTPYVFILNLSARHKPPLYQALVLSTRHGSINEAHLSGRSFTAMRDLLMKQYQQVFPSQDRTVKERNAAPTHPNIDKEHAELSKRSHQMACEAFGVGALPKLETAVYKLETRFRGSSSHTLAGRGELFRGTVKFSSSNLLESLQHCMSTTMAEGPITPLLSSITQKGRNNFVITEKDPEATSQTPARTT